MLSKSQVSSLEQDRSFVRGVAKQRQRFTPWLEQQIESGDIDGLEWIDKDIRIFKVPWARVDKPEFELETHAELFKRWASHTGKYRPGDQPDPSTWKTRFRCALRKMQEIVEIKRMGNLEGTRPYRVFKFEPKLKEGNSSSKRGQPRGSAGRRRSSSESSISIETTVSGLNLKEQLVPDYPHWRHPGMSEWDINQNTSEPWYLENWDMYFPEGVQNEFGYFEGPSFALTRDQEIMYSDVHGTCPLPSYFIQDGFNATMESCFLRRPPADVVNI